MPHDGVNGLRLLLLFVQAENTLSGSYHPNLTIMQFLHLRDVWKNPLARAYHRNLPESIRFRIILHQPVNATYQQILPTVFKKRAHIIVFDGGGVTGHMFIVRKAKSVEAVQSVLSSYPDKSALILKDLIDKTAGQFVISRIELTGLCRQRQDS